MKTITFNDIEFKKFLIQNIEYYRHNIFSGNDLIQLSVGVVNIETSKNGGNYEESIDAFIVQLKFMSPLSCFYIEHLSFKYTYMENRFRLFFNNCGLSDLSKFIGSVLRHCPIKKNKKIQLTP